MNRTGILLVALLGLACALPVTAGAQKPPKGGDFTFTAKPTTVVFGKSTVLSGRLSGSDKSGKTIEIQQMPFGASAFTPLTTRTTASSGTFTFTTVPTKKTTYRAVAQTTPAQTSSGVLVKVAMRVSLRLSDSTPARGAQVRFSGSVAPAHDGRVVYIQRRTATGAYRTVGRATLADAGASRSVFSRKMRVRSNGVYRARVLGDPDHETGTSSTRTATVH